MGAELTAHPGALREDVNKESLQSCNFSMAAPFNVLSSGKNSRGMRGCHNRPHGRGRSLFCVFSKLTPALPPSCDPDKSHVFPSVTSECRCSDSS
ncbi:hypothetical protein CCH79_00015668 [Gambusia affinis]|uniref:Uncharacterized protein n=1 Tax=Gambusia affinis TaxID=33528 RepID=A0A315VGF8_GAMAF|nr:hypothetical protein CCH79_00015668 [Gambusia affinis]